MICPTCGNPSEGGFCSRCGARLPSPPYAAPAQPAPAGYPPQAVPPTYPHPFYVPRVSSHIQTLSILWFVYAGYRVVTGIIAALFLFGISAHGFLDRFAPNNSFPFAPVGSFMSMIAVFVILATVVGSALAIITGYALINRKPWGRTFAIVIAVLALIRIPAGTALGIYTLWVLAPSTSGPEYEALTHHG